MEDGMIDNRVLKLNQMIKEYWILGNRNLDEIIELKNKIGLSVEEFDRMFRFYTRKDHELQDRFIEMDEF